MKRSAILRRTPLARVTPLRSKPKKRLSKTEAEYLWKQPVAGPCQCGCDRFSLRLQRHHVVYEQHVRADHGNVWALENSMLLHEHCHAKHHNAVRRIPLESVPDAALQFAIDLMMGEDRAILYFARYYGSEVSRRAA